jgi:IS5 family transposase
MNGVMKLMDLELMVPCYTTLCRRAKDLTVELPSSKEPTHIVIDSTGLKIYGEGEWKVRTHGVSKRRTWRKLHLAVNPETHEITSAVLSTNDFHDSEVFDDLLSDEERLEAVYADGAYDTKSCYKRLKELGADGKIPPRRGAVIQQHGNAKSPPLLRDQNIRGVRKLGRKVWKKSSSYHTRSLAETAMFRIKQIFGGSLSSRLFENQATEAFIRCRAMNFMSMMGMPKTLTIAT